MIKKNSFEHWAWVVSSLFFLIISCNVIKKVGNTDIVVLPGYKILYCDNYSEGVPEQLAFIKKHYSH